jgi:hypothetical protein
MAIKNASKESPTIFSGESNPNTAGITPGKVGDIYINTDLMVLNFCKSLTDTYKWGTAGTA